MLKIKSSGPQKAEILVLFEAPSLKDAIQGTNISGAAEAELQYQFKEVGLDYTNCRFTSVCKYSPPNEDIEEWVSDKKALVKKGFLEHKGKFIHPLVFEGLQELEEEIASCQPKLIIGLGSVALWALSGNTSIGNWRGSELSFQDIPFIPTYPSSNVLRNWALRPQVIADLRRAKKYLEGIELPTYKFNTSPTFGEIANFLKSIEDCDLAADIETAGGHILCLGLAKSKTEAICIPFKHIYGTFWSQDEKGEIVTLLRGVAERPGVRWIGQNWNYDAQYFDEDFYWTRMADFDTYIAQSVLFPGESRDLGYLASIYCDHYVFWKEDAKDWGKVKDFQQLFRYNCMDVCRTWEIAQKQNHLLTTTGLLPQFMDRMKYSHAVYKMMRRGVKRDPKRLAALKKEVKKGIAERELLLNSFAGKEVNFNSSKQVSDLLFKLKGFKSQAKTKSGAASTNNDALAKLLEKHPEAKEICAPILEARSLQSIQSNFLEAKDDPDGRFRSSWMATGTETFRMSSGGNAFHRGGPLQNITDGKHTHSGRPLPNLRSIIVPDEGYTIFNCDLERADLQVVAWEAEDVELKQMLREHFDVHTENAKGLWNTNNPTEQERHFGKTFVHLTNYGGKARTCAIKCGITVAKAEQLQKRWFEMHPGILQWHQRTMAALFGTRTIRNKFGYRIVYFDRVEGLLPEALAWIPQSSVALLISKMQMAIEHNLPDVQLQLQVHDSIVGQYPTGKEENILRQIKELTHIAIPYPDPLYIPLDLATSPSSWGEVEKRAWPN